ncbi:MAG: PDZ domain-containing protein [Luteolibacter sp.]|jgi:membrane-associated protease RseP (regulator of RpoE activity)|nr:PDZ domain-containing protein [Luteolibacter sp.]
MKTITFPTITAGLLAMLVAPATAIEAPPDDAPPPVEVMPPSVREAAPAADAAAVKAETAYLGVVSTEIPEMLAAHLGLAPVEGIVVRALMPDGPAAKAGLAVHDVITRVAGEAVDSSEDLTRQVTAHRPGDIVHLDVIHKGKPAGMEVTLGLRPEVAGMPPVAGPRALDDLNLDGIPKELADRVRGMIEGNLGELRLDFERGVEEAAPQMEDALRDMKRRMEKAMRGLQVPDIPQEGGIQIHQGATIRLMDEQGSIELKSNEGGKEITVRDKGHKIVWSGPWDTDQDKAAAPEDVRQRVERLNFDAGFGGNGLRLQFRGGDLAPEMPE